MSTTAHTESFATENCPREAPADNSRLERAGSEQPEPRCDAAAGPSSAEPASGLRLLLIGPTHRRGTSAVDIFGGTSKLTGEQVRELSARGLQITTVDSSGPVTNLSTAGSWFFKLVRLVRVLQGVVWRLPRTDVVCSIQTPERLFDYCALLWLLCRAFRRPLVLRISGGRVGRLYAETGRLRRLVADRTSLRADIVYVETRAALAEMPARDNLRRFPNTRQLPAHACRDRTEVRKLLFYSRIKPQKGLQECLKASESLPDGCELSVYGAATTGTDLTEITRFSRVVYKGMADPDDIPGILAEHDLLLFPTHWANEGLPGVILEALQAGMPVISTNVGGIPELVEHEVTGLVVKPRSVAELEAAIQRLADDPCLYRRLCEGAALRGEEFRSDRWYDSFADDLSSVARAAQPPLCGASAP